MRSKELKELGIPATLLAKTGITIRDAIRAGFDSNHIEKTIKDLIQKPEDYLKDSYWAALAKKLLQQKEAIIPFTPREKDAPWCQWGQNIAEGAIRQMENSCKLPVSVCGALMPDAHPGYGLPIGGVLAVDNAVIPFAVGVDIACRMKMTIYAQSPTLLKEQKDLLIQALEKETAFGLDAGFDQPRDHEVMEEDWNITHTTKCMKDRAWRQLGSSGSGNHFVEFGELTVTESSHALGLEPGTYLALISHSGSRGAGANVANFYSNLATQQHPELPEELKHLAWLSLDSCEGQEYWKAMQLMGRYAAANHDCIHQHITKAIKGDVIKQIENHHNFAWKEVHNGKEVIVHRKGATPAGLGVLGIIPGTMADTAYVVVGKGSDASLHSSSHGAGRKMSRMQAKKHFTWKDTQRYLDKKGVTLLSAGLDECPMAYKDIDEVMAGQEDLVDIVASFEPKLVKMAHPGEKPED